MWAYILIMTTYIYASMQLIFLRVTCNLFSRMLTLYNKSTASGTKYARQIFKEAMILTFD
jgi:hypothetical protein